MRARDNKARPKDISRRLRMFHKPPKDSVCWENVLEGDEGDLQGAPSDRVIIRRRTLNLL